MGTTADPIGGGMGGGMGGGAGGAGGYQGPPFSSAARPGITAYNPWWTEIRVHFHYVLLQVPSGITSHRHIKSLTHRHEESKCGITGNEPMLYGIPENSTKNLPKFFSFFFVFSLGN